MIPGNFQGRAAKFGEDAVALQMPIISRRTSKFAKNDARDYAVVEFSTKDVKTVEFSCFVGTDNNAAKVQALDYSLGLYRLKSYRVRFEQEKNALFASN